MQGWAGCRPVAAEFRMAAQTGMCTLPHSPGPPPSNTHLVLAELLAGWLCAVLPGERAQLLVAAHARRRCPQPLGNSRPWRFRTALCPLQMPRPQGDTLLGLTWTTSSRVSGTLHTSASATSNCEGRRLMCAGSPGGPCPAQTPPQDHSGPVPCVKTSAGLCAHPASQSPPATVRTSSRLSGTSSRPVAHGPGLSCSLFFWGDETCLCSPCHRRHAEQRTVRVAQQLCCTSLQVGRQRHTHSPARPLQQLRPLGSPGGAGLCHHEHLHRR